MQTKDILKELRKSKGYSNAKDFCEDFGISFNTYQNYETGKRIPTAEILIKLADFYGVTTDYLLGREPEQNPIAMLNLENREQSILEVYTQLPKELRQTLIDIMIQLTEAAKNENDSPIITFRRLSTNKASAGCGYDLNNVDEWREIEVVDTPEARQADFAVEIDGASMEPTYYDGDILYIQLAKEIPVGKIGLFMKGGKGYVKEYGEDRLISHNDDYDDIYPDDEQIECIGRVIGVAELP